MTSIKLLISSILLTPIAFGAVSPTSEREMKNEPVKIKLSRESEFYPTEYYKDSASKTLYGTIADNDSIYRDGKTKYHSYFRKENAEFTFALPENYTEISIDSTIKVSSMYDQYYSKLDVLVPVGADTLVSSQEIFELKGSVSKGEGATQIGKGTVTTIIDRWGSDNYGYGDVEWFMELNDFGNELTISCKGYETGDIWAGGSPGWYISEMTTALPEDVEYHKKEGNGAPLSYYNFQDPEDYHDNYLYVYGII